MFSPDDTIVAIATPAGRGGLGVVRISGSEAVAIATRVLEPDTTLAPRHATFTRVCDRVDETSRRFLDEVIAIWFPAPRSYTGEHVVEISAHGSPVVLESIVRSAIESGARLARPGEFTFRAYLNDKLDLVQAEAVADLIDAVTPLQARTAFDQLEGTLTTRIGELDQRLLDLIAGLEASIDFPDEGYHFIQPEAIASEVSGVVAEIEAMLHQALRGRIIREGATVAIVGRPNVGKSSLFNALLGHARAIVSEIAGTTRDLVTERCELDGLAITLVDTAGVREANEIVEVEGVRRALGARAAADLVLVVLDVSERLSSADQRLLDDTAGVNRVIVANKVDQGNAWDLPAIVRVSAVTTDGIDRLRTSIARRLTGDGGEALCDSAVITNVRHTALLGHARDALVRARDASAMRANEEFVLTDLHAARASLAEIVGASTPEDVLNRIFERFCIGK